MISGATVGAAWAGGVEGRTHRSEPKLGRFVRRGSSDDCRDLRFCVLDRLRVSLAGDCSVHRAPRVWICR